IPRAKILIVYILSEVRQPVSRGLIAGFASEDEIAVQEVIDDWLQFLHHETVEGEKRYSVYHTSFRDFLGRKDIVKAAGVSIPGINERIAKHLWLHLYGEELE